jgi:zinc protease
MSIAPKIIKNSLPGADDITRVQLKNGITVLTRPNFNNPSVVINGYLSTGSLFDPDDKLGLADFAAMSLMRGTEKHNFQQLFEALESTGASLGFGANIHTTSFNGRALAEDLPLLLDLLQEAVRTPVFPSDQVERLRAQLLTGLDMRAQDTGDMAALTFDQLVFREHPYRRPEEGYIETVQAITRNELAGYAQDHFGPRGLVIVIVGAVEPQKAVEFVESALGTWENPLQTDVPALPPVIPLTENMYRKVDITDKSQSDIVMGTHGPTRRAPDYMAASLGNNILGQFGMMGRIGEVVREQSGLAYYAYTMLSSGIGPGTWEVSAGVNPENIEKAVELIRQEIRQFVDERVSEEELSDSKANYIGRLPLSLESNNGIASALLNLERHQLGLDYYREYAGLVNAVTIDEVLNAARHYLNPDCLAVAVAGPK